MATWADLRRLGDGLDVALQRFKSGLEARLEQVKWDFIKCMLVAMTVQTALIVGLILGLPRLF